METKQTERMPAVFVSHGAPTVAIEDTPYSQALALFGRRYRPQAIVAISAHWVSPLPIQVTSAAKHALIHDFYGFPRELYELRYDAPGSPRLADRIVELLTDSGWPSQATDARGLDHGVWVPLGMMYPEARVPVVQISLPMGFAPQKLYRIGRVLAPLREDGGMILGSGGIVHNLRFVARAIRDAHAAPWAAEFDRWFKEHTEQRKLDELFCYREQAPSAEMAAPSTEHFDPVFVVLGAASAHGPVETIFEGFQYGNISMRSFAIA